MDTGIQKSTIDKLIKQVNKPPELKYSENLITFKDNIESTIRLVKQRLGTLQTLKSEIDYILTLTHSDDEEFI